jgi:hypothetical protein
MLRNMAIVPGQRPWQNFLAREFGRSLCGKNPQKLLLEPFFDFGDRSAPAPQLRLGGGGAAIQPPA